MSYYEEDDGDWEYEYIARSTPEDGSAIKGIMVLFLIEMVLASIGLLIWWAFFYR